MQMLKPERFAKRIMIVVGVVLFGALGYLFTNLFGSLVGAYEIGFDLDKKIPFIPEFVYVYFFVFVFMASPVFLVPKLQDFFCIILGYAVIMTISFSIFMQFPTTMSRPAINFGGVTGNLFIVMRAIDGPNNLFPSLHVSSSVFIALVNGYFCPKSRIVSWIVALLIIASTLFIKQHVLIDVLGGAVLGGLAYVLVKVLRA